jgi:hypothetical protein
MLWISSACDVWDLGGGECHNVKVSVIAEDGVEIVKITPCGAKNQDLLHDIPPDGVFA